MSLANESKPGVPAAIVDLPCAQGALTTPSLDVQAILIVRIEYHVLMKLSRILSNF